MLLLALAAAAGCATGNAQSSSHDQDIRVLNGGTSTAIAVRATNTASVTRVGYPIDRVWRALPAAYDSLKIPLTTLDAGKHLIGNEGMKARQRLGNVSMSTYIDCGQAQIGPSADSYDIYLEVTTTARSVSPTETELSTMVVSAAKPLQFSQEYSRCSTKGTIEDQISKIVSARLASMK
jgi:hypothetical protein